MSTVTKKRLAHLFTNYPIFENFRIDVLSWSDFDTTFTNDVVLLSVLATNLRHFLSLTLQLRLGSHFFDEPSDVGNSLESLLEVCGCLLYTSPSPRDATLSRMPSSA